MHIFHFWKYIIIEIKIKADFKALASRIINFAFKEKNWIICWYKLLIYTELNKTYYKIIKSKTRT